MADEGGIIVDGTQEDNISDSKNLDDACEPPASKRVKLDEKDEYDQYILEERLNQILSCTVCYDMPSLSFYQVRGQLRAA